MNHCQTSSTVQTTRTMFMWTSKFEVHRTGIIQIYLFQCFLVFVYITVEISYRLYSVNIVFIFIDIRSCVADYFGNAVVSSSYAVVCCSCAVVCRCCAVICCCYVVICRCCAVICRCSAVTCRCYAMVYRCYAVVCRCWVVVCRT
jgi:hypothetical protein